MSAATYVKLSPVDWLFKIRTITISAVMKLLLDISGSIFGIVSVQGFCLKNYGCV